MPSLSIISLAKSFRAGTSACSAHVSVLRDVHLALWPGEIVALVGAAGSGKSTLLRCAAALLRPDAGSIRWFGGRSAPANRVVYASGPARPDGALYASLVCATSAAPRILLVDDLELAGAIERRLVVHALLSHAECGAAVLVAAGESASEIASESVATRAVTLAHGVLTQRRNRSATRIAASSFASRARASARSTYGRNFRSPQ
jgi:ABC-type cobalamin/Fe3+-siderophores transport system ATPase subunit